METADKKRVLIVEDEEDVVTYLKYWFSDEGFEVETAGNGFEASEKTRTFKPDFITLDIVLPEKTGVNFYGEIKNNPETANIPIIIITGLRDEFKNFIFNRRTAPPPDGYISKPFDREKLLRTVWEVIGKKIVVATT